MRSAILASIFTAAVVFAAPSLAQEKQEVDDIVQFFSRAIDLGATRGICVGTEEECSQRREQENAAIPTGLDMLINFDLDSSELTTEARGKLSEFATALRDNRLRAHSFVVEGHTDARGSESYNDELSFRRAQSVAAFLVASGIDVERLDAQGKGKTSPRVDDPMDPVNRRVEMRIKLQ